MVAGPVSTRLRYLLAAVVAVAALMAFAGVARAASCNDFWMGPNNGDWATASNWSNGVPTAATNVCLDNTDVAGSYTVDIDSYNPALVANSITIGGSGANIVTLAILGTGGGVQVGNTLTLTNASDGAGILPTGQVTLGMAEGNGTGQPGAIVTNGWGPRQPGHDHLGIDQPARTEQRRLRGLRQRGNSQPQPGVPGQRTRCEQRHDQHRLGGHREVRLLPDRGELHSDRGNDRQPGHLRGARRDLRGHGWGEHGQPAIPHQRQRRRHGERGRNRHRLPARGDRGGQAGQQHRTRIHPLGLGRAGLHPG